LRQLVAFGPRPAGSAAIEQSRGYIKKQLADAGIAVAEQAWDDQTPTGRVHMVNLIATIPGASKNRLVIGGHYDTKRFPFRFVGANDGGSSAAFLIELARVLKARRNPVTIDIVFLDGEEAVIDWTGNDHTYGSRHYVAEAKRTGTLSSLKAFVLVDMIGDRDLQIKRDLNSTTWLTDMIWSAAQNRQLSSYFRPERVQIEDDHLPFMEAGVPSVDIIDLEYPAWHTAGDTLDAVSARSLQVVGDALLAALPQIEARIAK
jgi:Zn-dependent M28 family amino/carboxypeptidase